MKLKKPKFWDYKKPTFLAYFLWPLSFIVQIYSKIKKIITHKKKYKKIKTICIGNIYLGGTGKTSLSLKIYEILSEKGKKVCFIKKDYSNQKDEQKILKNKGKLFKSRKRKNALAEAINENYEIAIFDDGLQDNSIFFDLSFICFNNINWIGNGLTLPSGPLRENISQLKNYKNIFLNGNEENLEAIKKEIININPEINIFVGKYVPNNLNEFDRKQKYLAFSGIGNHQSFVSMLSIYGFNIVKELEFPDHYFYKISDINNIISTSNKLGCKILTTEKDYNRIKNYNLEDIKYIKTKLEITNEKNLFKIISSS